MPKENTERSGMISLKEAAERFGYSADYVGQLIRKGKVDGVQVHANVAWMTTVDAMEEYLLREKSKGKDESRPRSLSGFVTVVASRMFLGRATLLYRVFLSGLLVVFALFAIFSFYLLSVALDHYLVEKAKQDLLERKSEIAEIYATVNGEMPSWQDFLRSTDKILLNFSSARLVSLAQGSAESLPAPSFRRAHYAKQNTAVVVHLSYGTR